MEAVVSFRIVYIQLADTRGWMDGWMGGMDFGWIWNGLDRIGGFDYWATTLGLGKEEREKERKRGREEERGSNT